MKYARLRDTRQRVKGVLTGRRLSCSIEAASAEEADALFEERWAARTGGGNEPEMKPVLEKPWMTRAAMDLKRRTPMFTALTAVLCLLTACAPQRLTWTEVEVREAISQHRGDDDWYPVARGRGYEVKTLRGRSIPVERPQ